MRDDYENRKTEQGIRYSRYIASWVKTVYLEGKIVDERFVKWLKSEGLTEQEIQDIWYIFTNGKFELEKSAEKFIKSESK